jgi:hypothetical protein
LIFKQNSKFFLTEADILGSEFVRHLIGKGKVSDGQGKTEKYVEIVYLLEISRRRVGCLLFFCNGF